MKTREIIKYLTTEHKTLSGNKWTVIHTYRNITVLKLEQEGDNLIRIIVVFQPLCTMMHNISGQSIEWHDLMKYLNAACTAQWLYVFTKLMSNVGSEQVVANRSLDRKTKDSFVLNFCFFVSDAMLLHICPKSSVHLFKNGLSGEERNLNQWSYTNLLRVGDQYLFGRSRCKFVLEDGDDSIKATIEAEEEGDDNSDAEEDTEEAEDDDSTEDEEGDDNSKAEEKTKSRRNRFFIMRAIAMGTCGPKNDKEAAAAIYESISHDRKSNELLVMPTITKRIDKMTKYLPLDIMNLIKQHYEASSPRISQTKDVDTLLKELVSGDKFFVQLDGSAKDPPTNGPYNGVPGSKEPFVMPPNRTKLFAEPGTGLPSVIFEVDKFVPITYGGLRNRTNPVERKSRPFKGNPKATRFFSLSDYKVKFTKSIFRPTRNHRIGYVNEWRVVEVWLVPKQP
jgi:hypothetical protein